jgi:hypothetical protein
MTMTHVKAQVRINAKLTEPFMYRRRLKQGDGLAPLFLIWFWNMSTENCQWLKMQLYSVNELKYWDMQTMLEY